MYDNNHNNRLQFHPSQSAAEANATEEMHIHTTPEIPPTNRPKLFTLNRAEQARRRRPLPAIPVFTSRSQKRKKTKNKYPKCENS